MWITTDCQNEEDDNKLDQDAQIERGHHDSTCVKLTTSVNNVTSHRDTKNEKVRHENTSVELTTSVYDVAVIRDQPDSNKTTGPPQNMTIRWERSNFI